MSAAKPKRAPANEGTRYRHEITVTVETSHEQTVGDLEKIMRSRIGLFAKSIVVGKINQEVSE